MRQKIIIDADPGIGDAVAIALALCDPGLDVQAVTASAGVVRGTLATRNVQGIVETLDPPKWPRLGGCNVQTSASSIDYRATSVSAVELNGPQGLGDCELQIAEMHNLHESAKVMVDLIRNAPGEVAVLTLGPLTNVDMACELDPEFLGKLQGLYILGGTVECGGDVTAAAEFNMYANPQAARNVLLSPAPKTLVPLDVTRKVILTFDAYNRLFDEPRDSLTGLLSRLLPFSLRAHRQYLGLEGVALHEVTALCAVVRPGLFESERMAVDVETSGELTRGTTVFDRRGTPQWQTNIDVLRAVDSQGVLDYFSGIVKRWDETSG